MRNRTREGEVGAELLHLIQSRLPVEEAGRTSVLSKSWLQAWSTIPTLRFCVGKFQETKRMKLVDVDRILTRYLRDNIPIETFELKIPIENQESASHAEDLIRPVATKTCLKEFSLLVSFIPPNTHTDTDTDSESDSDSDSDSDMFTLPDEILSGENLTKIRVIQRIRGGKYALRMTTSHHPVIKCVSLQELHLYNVHISEEAFHHMLSSCSLLVKIELLHSCKGFKAIRVKNLAHLYDLTIIFDDSQSPALEISNVPNLGVFSYHHYQGRQYLDPIPFNADVHSISFGSVTELELEGVIANNACLDMIKSGCPSLESLVLHLSTWIFESFHFTCASIKSLFLQSCPCMLIDVQVHAPKLLFFSYHSLEILPNLLFPVSSLEKIKVSLQLKKRVDAYFFIMMRQALTVSRECDLDITFEKYYCNLSIDIKDLRTRLLFPPAMNVQQLCFGTSGDACLWERSPFFDAIFEICHPMRIYARSDRRFSRNNHFGRVMLKEVLEKKKTKTTETVYWPQYLKHVEIRQPFVQNRGTVDQNWETLTNSHRSLLDGSAPSVCLDFKLKWR